MSVRVLSALFASGVLAAVLVASASCAHPAEVVEVPATVEVLVEVTREVQVVVEVEREVLATRQVPVTVEVAKEIPVTRVVTATSTITPTPTPTPTNTSTPTATLTPTPTSTPIIVPRRTTSVVPGDYGEWVASGDARLRVVEVERDWKDDSAYLYYVADEGCQFIRIKLEVANAGPDGSRVRVEDGNFRVRGNNVFGYNCNGNPFLAGPRRQRFDSTLESGELVVGNFITGIQDEAYGLWLEFAPDLDSRATAFMSLEE